MKRFLSIVLVTLLLGVAWPVPSGRAQGSRPQFTPDAGIARLERERGPVRVRFDDAAGTLRLIEGDLANGVRGDEGTTARRFFQRYGDIFGLSDPAAELMIERIDRDGRGYTSVRFGQRYAGLVLDGGDVRADIDRNGSLHTVHGTLVPFPRPSTLAPAISSIEASRRARAVVGGTTEGQPRLVVVRHSTVDYLAWNVMVRTHAPALWRIQIDARTGTTLDMLQTLPAGKNIRTFDAENSFDLPGTLRRTTYANPVADQDINAAHDHAARVYDYYRSTFGRDSLDGNGMALVSSVHYLQNYNNAFWDPGQLQVVYGDGDDSTFAPLARSLDVVAHELTHGLTQFTAQLVYAGQSGALNEAYSDIFGALIDSDNWEIGEAVYTPAIEDDALRSLADPTRYGQPSVLGEYIVLPNTRGGDNGGVHVNSGIINHVAYTIAQMLGREKLAKIAYRTLTMKLTSDSDFIAARDLMVQACDELVEPAVVPAISTADCHRVRQIFVIAGWNTQTIQDDLHHVYAPQIANGTPDLQGQRDPQRRFRGRRTRLA